MLDINKVLPIISFFAGILIIPFFFLISNINSVSAQSEIEQLQNQITERNQRLSQIQAEIAEYEKALREVGAERETLQRAIRQLELERQKVEADIRLTEQKIATTDLSITRLTYKIEETEARINLSKEAVGQILRKVDSADNESVITVMLRNGNISEFWNEFEDLQAVRLAVMNSINELTSLKDQLENNKRMSSEERARLEALRRQYDSQQNILDGNRNEKSQLLSATQNEEAAYQQMLRERQEASNRLLAEVREIESQIKFILDPNTIPPKGTPVFIWPLDNIRITQYFGYTQFAMTTNAYRGNMHNGVDFGAPVGTPIYAPLTGTVRNIGNTDLVPGCYSWGKWLLIDHPNGLSSMFAHLSHIDVTPGQQVRTGDVVGYVGNTGFSTGPHLHYTLYVSAGVQVMQFNQFKSVTGCGAALSPFAGIEAYLDPLDYLPTPP